MTYERKIEKKLKPPARLYATHFNTGTQVLKNTNCLNSSLGTWSFVGILPFVDLPL